MKKVLLLYGLLVVVLVIFFVYRGGNFPNFGFGVSKTAKINNKTYTLITAKTEAEKIKGLSERSSLPKNTGMLFIFDTKGIYPFWMKNMKFPIDIIYISGDQIVDIFENAQVPAAGQSDADLPKYRPSTEANYVLEINANEVASQKIKKGDKVIFKGVK